MAACACDVLSSQHAAFRPARPMADLAQRILLSPNESLRHNAQLCVIFFFFFFAKDVRHSVLFVVDRLCSFCAFCSFGKQMERLHATVL